MFVRLRLSHFDMLITLFKYRQVVSFYDMSVVDACVYRPPTVQLTEVWLDTQAQHDNFPIM